MFAALQTSLFTCRIIVQIWKNNLKKSFLAKIELQDSFRTTSLFKFISLIWLTLGSLFWFWTNVEVFQLNLWDPLASNDGLQLHWMSYPTCSAVKTTSISSAEASGEFHLSVTGEGTYNTHSHIWFHNSDASLHFLLIAKRGHYYSFILHREGRARPVLIASLSQGQPFTLTAVSISESKSY